MRTPLIRFLGPRAKLIKNQVTNNQPRMLHFDIPMNSLDLVEKPQTANIIQYANEYEVPLKRIQVSEEERNTILGY